ncbi:7077_t:CDS:1, partial [Rhizophagus irregularis]
LKILPSIKGKEKEAVILNVENDDAEDDETPEEINVITNTREALNSLEKVIRYFKNPPDNIATNYTELKTFNTLRSKINGEFKMF